MAVTMAPPSPGTTYQGRPKASLWTRPRRKSIKGVQDAKRKFRL